jgi:UDP-2,3-diacylglucosamine hydrolase
MLLFVSDLHLDGDTPERTAAFFRLLETESARCEGIYVLGDLTEVWIGDDDDATFPSALADALRAAAARSRIFLMHGNRDFLFGAAFAHRCGVQLIGDTHVVETPRGRGLLAHGDTFCTRDTAYLAMRETLRSRAWQTDFLGQDLAVRREFVRGLRARSRAANANKAENIMDVTPEAVVEALRASGADFLVHGHTHRPAIHTHIVDGRALRRYVLGDWNRCGWRLRIDDSAASLECFPIANAG